MSPRFGGSSSSRLASGLVAAIGMVATLGGAWMWGRSQIQEINPPTYTLPERADTLTTSDGQIVVSQRDGWRVRIWHIEATDGISGPTELDLRALSQQAWLDTQQIRDPKEQDGKDGKDGKDSLDPKERKALDPDDRRQAQSPVQQQLPQSRLPKGGSRPLAPDWGAAPSVAVAPDGKTVAWVSGSSLIVADADGKATPTLTTLDHKGCIPLLGAQVLVVACERRLETRAAGGGPVLHVIEGKTSWLLQQQDGTVLALSGPSLYELRNATERPVAVNHASPASPRTFGLSGAAGDFAAATNDGSVVYNSYPASLTLTAPGVVDALAFLGNKLLVGGAFRGIQMIGGDADPQVLIPDVVGTRFVVVVNDRQVAYATADRVAVATIATSTRLNGLGAGLLLVAGAFAVALVLVTFGPGTSLLRRDPADSDSADAEPVAEPFTLPLPEPPAGLLSAWQEGECVLFGGAGLSAQAGYPTWQPFVEDLLRWSTETGRIDPAFSESLRAALRNGQVDPVADSLVNAVDKADCLQRLNEAFGRAQKVPRVHQLLKRLPWCAALTTNFDTLLERTYPDAVGRVLTPRDAERLGEHLGRREFFIAKLYGSLAEPETVLLAPAEYSQAVSRNLMFSQFMEGMFVSRTLLFIGASLEGIEAYLRGLTFSGPVTRTHYALVAVTDAGWRAKADLLRRRYSIEVLPYTPSADFTELPGFIERCVNALEADSTSERRTMSHTEGIRRIHLQNIGPFPDLTLELQADWNVILGDNGVGKSSILKALAACFCGKDVAPYAARLIRAGEPSGSILIETTRNTYRMEIRRKDTGADVHVVPTRPLEAEGILALGFPPLRAVSWDRPKGPTAEGQRRASVEDLLPLVKGDPDPRLDKLKQWIVNLDSRISYERSQGGDNRYERLLQRFFEIVDRVTPGMKIRFGHVNQDTREVTVVTDDGEIPIEMVSQGSVSLMGWIGVLLQRLYEIYGDDEDPTERYALVMIDEIDAHMHPEWQQSVVQDMSAIFPNVQYLATTHSPLVVGGMKGRQVLRFVRDSAGSTVQVPVTDEMLVGRADQILTGRLFGMKTTLDQTTQQSMEQYKVLLGKSVRSEREEAEFQRLNRELKFKIPLAQETTAERKAFALVQAIVNDQLGAMVPEAREPLLDKTKALIEEITDSHTRAL